MKVQHLAIGVAILAMLPVLAGSVLWGRSKVDCFPDFAYGITRAETYELVGSDTAALVEVTNYPDIEAGTMTHTDDAVVINYVGPDGQRVEVRYRLAPPDSDTYDSGYSK